MGFDIRLPIGYLFTILGALLALYGLMTSAAEYQRSLGININLFWGVILLIFVLLMMFFAKRARSRAVAEEPRPQTGGPVRRSSRAHTT